MRIELGNNYFIVVDPLNCTLKQYYTSKNKEGVEVQREKTHGYYSSVESAIKKYLELNQIDNMTGMVMDLDEYLKMIESVNMQAVKAIQSLLGGEENECK